MLTSFTKFPRERAADLGMKQFSMPKVHLLSLAIVFSEVPCPRGAYTVLREAEHKETTHENIEEWKRGMQGAMGADWMGH